MSGVPAAAARRVAVDGAPGRDGATALRALRVVPGSGTKGT